MQLDLIAEADMSPQLDAEIRNGLCRCFPADREIYAETRAWHGAVPAYSVVLTDAGIVVAHLGVVDRTITVAGRPLRVAGVENVYVLPERRGQGLSRRVLIPAMDEALRREFDAGLLFCLPTLAALYGSCDWQTLSGCEIVRTEDGCELPLPAKNIAMFYPLRVASFPAGRLHLGGNDW
jgi:GNAT superfamily N-acetyltransferase